MIPSTGALLLALCFAAGCEFASDGLAHDSTDGGSATEDGSATSPTDAGNEIGDAVAVDGARVELGTAGQYAILAKAAISGTTASVTGNLGISPAAATLITGFSLSLESPNVYSSSAQIIGSVYAADYPVPTPANLTQAVSDMEQACLDAAARTPDPGLIELNDGDLGGMTLAPGIYRWSGGVTIASSVTLYGSATSVWIFQIAQDLTMASNTNIVLRGGARPDHVFWQVSGGPVTIGTMAHFEGVVLTDTAVTVQAGATLTGRVLSQTAVTIDGATVMAP